MKQQFFDWLKRQGLCPEMDGDAIYFKYQMKNFVYYADSEDSEFFQLCLPGIYDVTNDNFAQVYMALNDVATGRKVVKAGVVKDSVWIFFEVLLDGSPVLDDIVPRGINMLTGAQEFFYEKIKQY